MNEKENNEKKKHILGLLVEDHPGVLQRLSGMFVRRGFNIDTIIVGKTAVSGVSHIIISLTADSATLEQLEKQVSKIIEVVKVVDLGSNSVVREHCLVKVKSDSKTNQFVLNLAKINNANVLESNNKSIIIEIISEPKKIDEFVKSLEEYGIKELSRTGINSMTRE